MPLQVPTLESEQTRWAGPSPGLSLGRIGMGGGSPFPGGPAFLWDFIPCFSPKGLFPKMRRTMESEA